MAGRVSFPYTEVYAAAKDGLIGFTRVLRADYHARGVSASVLILGAIRGAGQGQRMLDESGMKASGFMAPAEAVARAVVKAVKKDRAELVVHARARAASCGPSWTTSPPSGPPSTGQPEQPPPCKGSSNSVRRNQALRYEVA